MSYDPRATANLLLDLADGCGFAITHMALHKIAYHAHGWRLAQTGAPLLREEFEAWEHGPVLPTVYAAFKAAGRKPITFRAERFDPVLQKRLIASSNFSGEDRAFLRDILGAYGPLDALTLSDMTHRRGGPWDQVWNAPGGKITLGMRIRNEAIRADFLRLPAHTGDRSNDPLQPGTREERAGRMASS